MGDSGSLQTVVPLKSAEERSYGSGVAEVVPLLRAGGLRVRFAFQLFTLYRVGQRAERGSLLEEVGHVSHLKEQERVKILKDF